MLKHFFLPLFAVIFIQNTIAQTHTATLVKDIATAPAVYQNDQASQNTAVLQNEVFFSVRIENENYLVAFDGTTKRIVFNITSDIDTFVVANNKLFFTTNLQNRGWRVWASDGTTAGTIAVTDTSTSRPFLVGNFNNKCVFGNGTRLFCTTGTAASTVLLRNIPGFDKNYQVLNAQPNKLFFTINNGTALWHTDGTSAGTLNLANTTTYFTNMAVPLSGSINFSYRLWGGYQDGTTFYFSEATNDIPNLWQTDGTIAGTRSILQNALPRAMLRYGSKILIVLHDNKVYLHDGITTPTLVTDYMANDQTRPIAVNGGILLNLIPVNDPNGLATYKFDGVNFTFFKRLSTLFGQDAFNTDYHDFNGYTYFICNFALWRSDGTPSGTARVKSIAPNYTANDFVVRNNKLFFTGVQTTTNNDFEHTVFATSGTSATTLSLPVTLLNTNYNLAPSTKYKTINAWTDNLYINTSIGNYSGLWRSDGTVAGTFKLADTSGTMPALIPTAQSQYFVFANQNYATMSRKGSGALLHKTDGTVSGTQAAVRFNGAKSSNCRNFYTLTPTKTLFVAETGANSTQLWVTDATTNGTILLSNIRIIDNALGSGWLGKINNIAYFTGYNLADATQNGLWRTDGTVAGTYLLKTFSLIGSKGVVLGNKLYFRADDDTSGAELWSSDGTTGGTQLVKDIYQGTNSSYPGGLMLFNNKIYFMAQTASGDCVLWVTNGTAAGTLQFKDPYATVQPYLEIYAYTVFNGTLYFRINNNGSTISDIWRTDGTVNGTTIVKSLSAVANCYLHILDGQFTTTNDALYFKGATTANSCDVVSSNGTMAGTQAVTTSAVRFAFESRNDNIINGWNNKILFKGINNNANYPYLADQNTLTRLSAVPMNSNSGLFRNDDNLYFVAAETTALGSEYYRANNNTDSGTMIADIYTGEYSSLPNNAFALGNGKFVFTAQNKNNAREIWLCDNNNAPVLLADIAEGVGASAPRDFSLIGNDLIFTAFKDNTGRELYKISGIAMPVATFSNNNTVPVLRVFPNPTAINSVIYIENATDNTAILYDITGKIVATQTIQTTDASFKLPNLAAGVYMLRCGMQIGKVIVQ